MIGFDNLVRISRNVHCRTCNVSWRSRGEDAETAVANDAEHSCARKRHQRSVNLKLPEGHARNVNDILSKHCELTDLEVSTFHIAQPSQLLVELEVGLVVAEPENGSILRGAWVHCSSLSPSGAGLRPTTTTLGCLFLGVLCELQPGNGEVSAWFWWRSNASCITGNASKLLSSKLNMQTAGDNSAKLQLPAPECF